MRKAILAGGLTALALGAAAQAPVRAQETHNTCFYPPQWDGGWKSPDDRTIFIRVSGHQIFRLDLAAACPDLSVPSSHLIVHYTSSSICRAIDWDLKVSQGGGIASPCIVKSMTLLSPAQVAALPKTALP